MGQCVEVRYVGTMVEVRDDSKAPGLGTLTFAGDEWDAFVLGAKNGGFDR